MLVDVGYEVQEEEEGVGQGLCRRVQPVRLRCVLSVCVYVCVCWL
jgi:hypothetical protein